jgi:serine/threonine protein kinase
LIDLKPENLLLDGNKNLKINDFGLSNMMRPGDLLRTFCGSPLYSSPEIILETNYIGPEVDVWALGVILYAMVCGYLPWDGDDLRTQMTNAVHARYEVPPHVSPGNPNIFLLSFTN